MIQLNGVMPPLTTPFDAAGRVDLGRLAANVARYNEAGLVGYVALGSNGEAVHLSRAERNQVIAAIKQAATPRHTVLAGVNEFATGAAIEAAQAAADAGADAALVVTPYFYKGAMTGEVLARFFTAVADASPVPVLIYNVPQNTGVVIDPAVIARLATHENVIGVKDSSGNMAAMGDTLRLSPGDFQVLVGNGSILYPALAMGAAGAVLAVACAAPRVCVELYEAVKAGRHDRARDLQTRLAPVSHLVTAGLGVKALKAALDRAGFFGGPPRPPLMTANDAEMEMIKAVLRASGLFPNLE